MFQKIINKFNELSPRQLLAMAGVAAVLMFGAIYFAISSLMNQSVEIVEPTPESKKIELVAVVVAKNNIQPNTRIQESMLQMQEMPEDIVPKDAIKSFDEVKNVQVHVPIFAGDILTVQKVTAEGKDDGFTSSIPPNCRAVSINVNDVTGVAGFAKPGDRVDLLLVEKDKYSATTELILQNVPLLSINQNTAGSAPIGENGVPSAPISNPSIATFALPPVDILKLISATKIGEIYMSLRPSKPQSNYTDDRIYTMPSVNAPQPEPANKPVSAPVIPSNSVPAPVPQAPVAPPTPKIEIISGDQIVQSSASTSAQQGNSTQQSTNSSAGGSFFEFSAPSPSAPSTTWQRPVIPSSGEYPLPPIPSVQNPPVPNLPVITQNN